MDEILRNIVDKTPSAQGAILMGFDGIAVEQWVREGLDLDIESMAMEFSFRFLELRDAAASLEMGQISDITLKAEFGTILVRVLSSEFFVAVLLESAGHMGKGRWVLRSQSKALAADLVN